MKKIIFTLNINDYSKEITNITYPFIKMWADKIGAEFVVISERKYPDFPITYEKLQVRDLAIKMNADWAIFIDSDTLVHPDLFDITEVIPVDTVLSHGKDFSPIRFKVDENFRKDGRFIGTSGWLVAAPKSCFDLWKPLEDLSKEEAIANCIPTKYESQKNITKEHLIDDYVVSRNIAKHNFNHITFRDLLEKWGISNHEYFFHQYLNTTQEKIVLLEQTKKAWGY